MADGSIYETLLGAEFSQLAPVLQQVHGAASPIHAAGSVAVTHGRGPVVALLNWLNGVPPARPDTPLGLTIDRSATTETWLRTFAGKPLRTRQWAHDGLFIEQSGPVKMAMRLEVRDGGLHFLPVHTHLLGLRLPRWLAVTVRAQVQPRENSWHILVETSAGPLGLLFRYEGIIHLSP